MRRIAAAFIVLLCAGLASAADRCVITRDVPYAYPGDGAKVKAVVMENSLIRVVILPERGGRVIEYTLKSAGHNQLGVTGDNPGLIDILGEKGESAFGDGLFFPGLAYKASVSRAGNSVTVSAASATVRVERTMTIFPGSTRLAVAVKYVNVGKAPVEMQVRIHPMWAVGGSADEQRMVFVPRRDGSVGSETDGFFDPVGGSWSICAPRQGESVAMTYRAAEVDKLYVWSADDGKAYTAEYFGVPKKVAPGKDVSLSCDYLIVKTSVYPPVSKAAIPSVATVVTPGVSYRYPTDGQAAVKAAIMENGMARVVVVPEGGRVIEYVSKASGRNQLDSAGANAGLADVVGEKGESSINAASYFYAADYAMAVTGAGKAVTVTKSSPTVKVERTMRLFPDSTRLNVKVKYTNVGKTPVTMQVRLHPAWAVGGKGAERRILVPTKEGLKDIGGGPELSNPSDAGYWLIYAPKQKELLLMAYRKPQVERLSTSSRGTSRYTAEYSGVSRRLAAGKNVSLECDYFILSSPADFALVEDAKGLLAAPAQAQLKKQVAELFAGL